MKDVSPTLGRVFALAEIEDLTVPEALVGDTLDSAELIEINRNHAAVDGFRHVAFCQRDLSEYEIVYLFVDGIAERLRHGQPACQSRFKTGPNATTCG